MDSMISKYRRNTVQALAALGAAPLLPAATPHALAQTQAQTQTQAWPTKPVKLIVPFPAGGGTDAFARPLSKVLAGTFGQSFVIDNRGGAGGTLGNELRKSYFK